MKGRYVPRMLLLSLIACLSCPEGLEPGPGRMCVATGDVTGTPGPLTSDRFQSSFERDACNALEDCLCDELDIDGGDCSDLDVDCGSFDWNGLDACTFDEVAADDCLSQRWDCDTDGDTVYAVAPEICGSVYTCE